MIAPSESIREEAKALARLMHPNVVTVYDLGVTGGQLYVAMQYVAGNDLHRFFSGPTPPPWQETLAIFITAGRALAAAHAAGVVHLRLVPFLNEATRIAFLRRVGGGYIFLHRTLQDHFAGTKSATVSTS